MTREEAIKTLKGEAWISCAEKWNEALDMAIEALEQEPTDTLDRIRAEIERERSFQRAMDEYDIATGLRTALEIIDKYMAEGSEE